jgi:hypothetical protein
MKIKNRFPELKRLAEKSNCIVEDDKIGCRIIVETIDGWSWEGGESCSQMTGYGSYVKEWRHDAIAEAIDKLEQDKPDKVLYKY